MPSSYSDAEFNALLAPTGGTSTYSDEEFNSLLSGGPPKGDSWSVLPRAIAGAGWDAFKTAAGAGASAVNSVMTKPAEWMGIGGKEDGSQAPFSEMFGNAIVPKGHQEITPFDYAAVDPAIQQGIQRLSPGAASVTAAVAQPVARMASSLAFDPLTYLMGSSAYGKIAQANPALAKTIQAAFTGQMGAGAIDRFKELLETADKKGWGADALEKGVETLLEGLGAGFGASHLLKGEHAPATPEGPLKQPKTGTVSETIGGVPTPMEAPPISQFDWNKYAPNDAHYVENIAGQAVKDMPSDLTGYTMESGLAMYPAKEGGYWVVSPDPNNPKSVRAAAHIDPETAGAQGLVDPSKPAGLDILHIVGESKGEGTQAIKDYLYSQNPTASGPHSPSFEKSIENFSKKSPAGGLGMESPPKVLEDGGASTSPPLEVEGLGDLNSPDPVANEGVRGLYMAGGELPATRVEELLHTYLSKVPIKAPYTTQFQTLFHDIIPREGITKVAAEIGVKPEQLFDAAGAVSELGRQLAASGRLGKMFDDLVEQAKNKPEVQKALDDIKGTVNSGAPIWDALGRAGNLLYSTDRNLKTLYQASLAGGMSVAAPNFFNGVLNFSLTRAGDWLTYAVAKSLGREELAQRALSGNAANATLTGAGASLGNVLSLVSRPFRKGEYKGPWWREHANVEALQRTLEYATPERAKAMYKFHSSEFNLDQLSKRGPVDKLAHLMLLPNIFQDTVVRNMTLKVELESFLERHSDKLGPIMKGGRTTWEAAEILAKVDKKFAEDLKHEMVTAGTEALRATGGLRAPEGSLTRQAVDLWAKLPAPFWILGPFMNFPLSNVLPIVMEHTPLGMLIPGTRANKSVRLGGEKSTLAGWETSFKEGLKKENLSGPESEALLILKKDIKKSTSKLEKWEKEGLYRPERVYARAATGTMLIAMAASAYYLMGDKGLEYNQIPASPDEGREGKQTVTDISSSLGAHAPYFLMGHRIAMDALGSERYKTPEGKANWLSTLRGELEAVGIPFLSSRTGAPSWATLMNPETKDEGLEKAVTRIGSDFARAMTSGAWMGDLLRGGAGLMNPKEQNLSRRTDLSMKDGMEVNIPFPGGKTSLPPSYDKTSGEPRYAGGAFTKNFTRFPLGRNIGDFLPGRREEVNPISLFIQNNPGWLRAADVLVKNTSDPAYDKLVMENLKRGYDETLLPWLKDEAKQLPREARTAQFTEIMQTLREGAHDQAINEYVEKGKDLPREIQKPLEERIKRENLKMQTVPPLIYPLGAGRPSPRDILQLQGKDDLNIGP